MTHARSHALVVDRITPTHRRVRLVEQRPIVRVSPIRAALFAGGTGMLLGGVWLVRDLAQMASAGALLLSLAAAACFVVAGLLAR